MRCRLAVPDFLGRAVSWDKENKVNRKGIQVNWNEVQPTECSQQRCKTFSCNWQRKYLLSTWEEPARTMEGTWQKKWDIPKRWKDWYSHAAQTDPILLHFITFHLFSQKQFSFFTSFCLSVTSCKTWNLDYRICIPMKICTWTIKLKDAYSEATERFSQQNCFWGLGKWPVSLISWGKPPQQSPQGQSSALHWTRNCKFWLFGGFTERSPGLVPTHIASNNRFVHDEKKNLQDILAKISVDEFKNLMKWLIKWP